MSRRFFHISLALVLLLSSEAWAIGLGDIRLDSALNEPLRAEIELLSATPEELANIKVALASGDAFARYGIDRSLLLQDIEFTVRSDGADSVVQLRSGSPITEPFLTFLVEATWSSGRLLREYTVLLDPPTYAPPAAQQAPAVTAPRRETPADSGRIERQPPVVRPQPSSPPPQPRPAAAPPPPAPVDEASYATGSGRSYVVQRGETLWGIASRMRPDGRLTMNQTMVAIYEANPQAFGGNINLLRAGAALRVPSADEIFRISRGNAFGEVKRQNEAWGSGTVAPAAETRPSLTLVPPDEEPEGVVYDDDLVADEPLTREQELENQIQALESADVPDQPSLIQIRDNELAALRQELANIRGEVYEPPVDVLDEPFVDEPVADAAIEDVVDAMPGDDELPADDQAADDQVADDVADDVTTDEVVPSTVVRTPRASRPGIGERILDALTSTWGAIIAALLVLGGILFWFMRRERAEDGEGIAPWDGLDSDEVPEETFTATETMRAPTPDEAILVVEQDAASKAPGDDTVEVPAADIEVTDQPAAEEAEFGSLEDTFSSDTAMNLDQTDPMAEADFHMAYGLYDQAADLVHGALANDPGNKGLMAKLCEIYFVWGNRDAFIEAAGNLKSAVGDSEDNEWDKIVIMGQQIAGDHEMFSGADLGAATRAVDMAFDDDSGDAGALDMDFGGGEDTMTSDAIDLGSDADVDFEFGESDDFNIESTAETPAVGDATAKTLEIPAQQYTDESPTIEEELGDFDGTSELPALEATLDEAISDLGPPTDATAEINLDDLDLGLEDLAETELGSMDDLDSSFIGEGLADESTDSTSDTGKNPQVDSGRTGLHESLGLDELLDDDATGEMRLAADETGRNPLLDTAENEALQSSVDVDPSLLDATGITSVLSGDEAVVAGESDEPVTDLDSLLADEATMLGPRDDDDEEAKLAKTQALPAEVFDDGNVDETGEMPAVPGSTDVDLDLEDLTAALKVTEIGDTIEQSLDDETREQPLDDETKEQPGPLGADSTAEIATMSLGPEDMDDDLHEARTMTEVGTKLDLARAYVDMGDPSGARSILEEVLEEGDESQRQQAQQLLDTLPG